MKKRKGKCNECQEYSKENGSILCKHCNESLVKRLKQNAVDIDKGEEDRLEFLLRVAKELGLEKSEEKIKQQYRQGYGDDLILRDSIVLWAPKGASKNVGVQRILK